MSDTKHTPGPWRAACRRGYAAVASGPEGNTVMVADCRTVDVDLPTATANARLIAAAPELLRIATKIMASYDAGHLIYSWGTKGGNSQVEMLRSAIAAATGE